MSDPQLQFYSTTAITLIGNLYNTQIHPVFQGIRTIRLCQFKDLPGAIFLIPLLFLIDTLSQGNKLHI